MSPTKATQTKNTRCKTTKWSISSESQSSWNLLFTPANNPSYYSRAAKVKNPLWKNKTQRVYSIISNLWHLSLLLITRQGWSRLWEAESRSLNFSKKSSSTCKEASKEDRRSSQFTSLTLGLSLTTLSHTKDLWVTRLPRRPIRPMILRFKFKGTNRRMSRCGWLKWMSKFAKRKMKRLRIMKW